MAEEIIMKKESNNEESKKYIGQAKWFNDKCGYGFINYPFGKEGIENGSKDIFVHYSNITPKTENTYKALHTGEYVEFEISNIKEELKNSDMKIQAVNVSGIGGGMLMNEYKNFSSNTVRPNTRPSFGKGGKGKKNE